MAWRLGAKTRVSVFGAAVGLRLCPLAGISIEWVCAAHPDCHVLFVPGGYTAELQPADILIQQRLKHINRSCAQPHPNFNNVTGARPSWDDPSVKTFGNRRGMTKVRSTARVNRGKDRCYDSPTRRGDE